MLEETEEKSNDLVGLVRVALPVHGTPCGLKVMLMTVGLPDFLLPCFCVSLPNHKQRVAKG